MILSDSKRREIRKLAGILYSRGLDTNVIGEVTPPICAVMEGHYFAFMRFTDTTTGSAILFSNNPPEFIDVYTLVQDKDFIMKNLVHSQRTVSLREIPGWNSRLYHDFTVPVQKIRPISDVIYVPSRIDDTLSGYWGIARAGLNSPAFDEDDCLLFKLISAFLTDAVRRSFSSVPQVDDVAHLDAQGRILFAGTRIGSSFTEIFGPAARERPCESKNPSGEAFHRLFFGFLGSPSPWNSRFLWIGPSGGKYDFSFHRQPRSAEASLSRNGAVVTVVQEPDARDEETPVFPADSLRLRYGLTVREIDVVRGVYRGRTNKEIGIGLGITEVTVKKHIGSIFEKTGAVSRTTLLLRLSF